MAEYAVLIPYVTTEYGDALLMEVRSTHVRQPGEICFPGGRIECGEDPCGAAVREACEELGLAPEDIRVISGPETEMMADGRTVYSVRAELDQEVPGRLTLSDCEVAEVFLLPVRWLSENPPAFYDLDKTADEELPDKLREYLTHYAEFRRKGSTYYWEYENHGIWGLTARIITGIL